MYLIYQDLKKIRKWIWISLATLISIMGVAFLWSEGQLDRMYGGKTPNVDLFQFRPVTGKMAIVHTNILSIAGDSFVTDQTLIFNQKEILAINQDSTFDVDTRVIDGKGKYLIPGLVDSHVHLFKSKNDLLLYLVNGITGIREMKGRAFHLAWRDSIRRGHLGPRMFVASEKLQSYKRMTGVFNKWARGDLNVKYTQPKEELLNSLEEEGYDAIKLGSHLSAEDYRLIQEASEDLSIPIVGHIPYSMEFEDFWKSNQYEVAHIEEFVKALINSYYEQGLNDTDTLLLDYVSEQAPLVSQKMVDRDIAVVSTLWLMESLLPQKLALDSLLQAVELSYVNPGLVEGTPMTKRALGWLPEMNLYRMPKDLSEEEKTGRLSYWAQYIEAHHLLLASMLEKEVRILAGTDANLPVVVPGFSLHDELESLVKGGMSPLQALQSATLIPNEWMGIKSGKITRGYIPDLLILEGNPLENIRNTRSICGVVAHGKYFDRGLLDEMLSELKRINGQSRRKDISPWIQPQE